MSAVQHLHSSIDAEASARELTRRRRHRVRARIAHMHPLGPDGPSLLAGSEEVDHVRLLPMIASSFLSFFLSIVRPSQDLGLEDEPEKIASGKEALRIQRVHARHLFRFEVSFCKMAYS